MKNFVFLIIVVCLGVAGFGVYNYFEKFNRFQNANAPRPELIVFASSSFVGPYGPGNYLKSEFEKICVCNVSLVDAGGTEILFQKLKIKGTVVDVVVGLDQINLKRAELTTKWRGLKAPIRNWDPIYKNNHYSEFQPYDWAPMTFIFRKSDAFVGNKQVSDFLKSLPDKSLILQDPDLSTPGTQFVLWWNQSRERFAGLKNKVQSLAPDWSAAYGLFKNKQAKTTFTYLTSIVYHWEEEKDFSYEVAQFEDGHIAQIEYAGVPELCRSCALAERFVEFLTETASQKEIMNKNYMLPIVDGITAGTAFEKLPKVKLLSVEKMDTFVDQQGEIVKAYREFLGRK